MHTFASLSVLRDAPFDRPADFDLQQHLQSTLGIFHTDAPSTRVRIRFLGDAARYVSERHWRATQQLTPHPDGSATLQLELSDLTELRSWTLSFGAKAIVEEPKELREREEVRRTAVVLVEEYSTCRTVEVNR